MTNSTSDPVKSIDFITNLFNSESNISAFLCKSSLFRNARFPSDRPASTEALRQFSAKLHVYYGLEVEPSTDALCESAGRFNETSPQLVRQVHPFARSRVYDLRRYKAANLWGPFMDDGSLRVDWEKIQCIMIDLCYNLRMYTERHHPSSSLGTASTPFTTTTSSDSAATSPSSSTSATASSPSTSSTSSSRRTSSANHLWDAPFAGLAPNSYVSRPFSGDLAPPRNPDLSLQDPYGVTGTWMRIVCFLDYNDLYAFNFENGLIPLQQEREPIETREAFRLIRLQLWVTDVRMPGPQDRYWCLGANVGTKEGRETLRVAEEGEDGLEEWRRWPIVSFEGMSKSTYMSWDPNANSRIRGKSHPSSSALPSHTPCLLRYQTD
jgi:hypothetical protein